jgi:uncharacterized protein
VSGSLFDTNVWIAIVFPTHPFHVLAQDALVRTSVANPAVMCRSTQQSFLRLASTATILKAYGAEASTNRDALIVMDSLLSLPQVVTRTEPEGAFEMRKIPHRLKCGWTPTLQPLPSRVAQILSR